MARRHDTDGDFDRQIRNPATGVPADVIARREAYQAERQAAADRSLARQAAYADGQARILALSHNPYDDEGGW